MKAPGAIKGIDNQPGRPGSGWPEITAPLADGTQANSFPAFTQLGPVPKNAINGVDQPQLGIGNASVPAKNG